MSTIHDTPFLRRFDALWARLRRVQFGQSLTLWGWIVLAGLVLLITADFWLELPWKVRAGGAVVAAVIAGAWGFLLARLFLESGTKPRTASEIERSFPQLGQSIRTTVQYGEASADQVRAAGVRESLVSALEEETHARSRGLHLDTIVPTQRLWIAVGGLAVFAAALLGGAAFNWEWRVAASRALLSETPYTQVALEPGNLKVDQGAPVDIRLLVSGRTDREIRLLTRPAGDAKAPWAERDFAASEGRAEGPRTLAFGSRIESIKKPLEYKGVAGTIESPVYRIDVRYPLAMKKVEVELTPPAYTNHPPQATEDPNITAVEGTTAKFRITLDQPARAASLVLTDLARRDDEEQRPQSRTLPLVVDGAALTAVLPLTGDMKYSIVAETSEGQRLPENSYRIRVRPDQPPEVYFESPRDPIDVHTLAEVLMRIRVRDDFGLARAGIIFEVNNEEEYPLLSEDFATAAEELQKLGKLTPDTQAALEKVLPLEFFQLKMTDSVAYYAFAEDNYPGTPHRSVTDLRFVDIRPFRIRYSVRDDDPAGGGGDGGPKIATLEELIKRQRFSLNRSMTVARRAERQEKIDLATIDGLVSSEAETAQATRQLADFLGGLMVEELNDEIQLLLQAESHMLAAADSLSAGKYDTAVLQQRDALKELIEGRNRLREEFQKNPSKFRAVAAADRRMAQKLRRPKSDKEEAEEVARRLKQLAAEQSEIGDSLMASMSEEGSGGSEPSEKTEPGDTPMPMAPMEGADKSAKEPKPEGTKPGGMNETPARQGSEPGKDEAPPAGMSPQERRDKQLDNVLEAQDIDKALNKLKNVTELAKQRMTDSMKSLEGANSALDRGERIEALEHSSQAVATLDELARHVEGLLKEEAAQRLDDARQLASQLAQAQQDLAAETPGENGQEKEPRRDPPMSGQSGMSEKTEKPETGSSGQTKEPMEKPGSGGGEGKPDDQTKPGSGSGAADPMKSDPRDPKKGGGSGEQGEDKEQQKNEGLAREAQRNAETGKTVVDLLQSILKSTNPADKDVIAKVDAILKENKLEETVARMEELAKQLREGKTSDARILAADSADRWEATANRLAVAFREVAAPRLEDLMKLEQELQTLQDELNRLQEERDVMKWMVAAGKLMEKMEEMKVGGEAREKLEEMMKEAGWTENAERFQLKGGGWAFEEKEQRIGVPTGYTLAIRDVTRDVQAHIQELILGDLMSGGETEASPPQYEKLVERYYEVLARQKRPEAK